MGKLSTPTNIFTRKNLLINGDMRIAQWSDGSVTGIGNGDTGYHTIDRWKFQEAGSIGGVATFDQTSADVPAGSGFQNVFQITPTTTEAAVAADEYAVLFQSIEAQDLQHLKYGEVFPRDLTLTFYLKIANSSGYICVYVNQPDADRIYMKEFEILADFWGRFTMTIPGDAYGTINDDNGAGLNVGFVLFAGSNYHSSSTEQWNDTILSHLCTSNQTNWWGNTANVFRLTGVQLELGKQSTDFEHWPLEHELSMCQRYLYKTYQINTPIGNATNTGAWGYNHCRGSIDYRTYVPYGPVRMRTTPTVTFYSGSTGASGKIRNQTAGADVTMTSLDEGECGCSDHDIGTAPTNGDKFQGQYACDAEL